MMRSRSLDRLTDRELDIMRHAVEEEWARRIEQRNRERHEERRRRRLELVHVGEAERTTKYRSGGRVPVPVGEVRKPRPRGAGGRVVAVDRRRKVRAVECDTCGGLFDYPLKRGRAPRSCPTCKGTP